MSCLDRKWYSIISIWLKDLHLHPNGTWGQYSRMIISLKMSPFKDKLPIIVNQLGGLPCIILVIIKVSELWNEKYTHRTQFILRIIYRDYWSTYEYLMPATETPTMLTRHLCVVLHEVFKSINVSVNSYLLQPKKKTTTFRLTGIVYLGVKLWYDNVCDFSDYRKNWFLDLKTSIDDNSVLLIDGSDFDTFIEIILADYVPLIYIVVMLFHEYIFPPTIP